MPLADITGRTYGPIPYRLGREKIADFIEATHESPERWSESAPPAFAGALLFAVAPALLRDPDLASHSHGVIHGDQSFTWHRSLTYGLDLTVLGTVTKLRERGGVAFLGFGLSVTDADGGSVVDGSSTFVLSGEESAASGHVEEDEPGPDQLFPAEIDGASLLRTATRRDLVKYAGASRDYNPLHWDHATAVDAGLPGVVVHGLLQSAWMLTAVASHDTDRPVASARFRYRSPLRPGVTVGLVSVDSPDGSIDVTVTDGETDYVTGKVEPAT